MKKIGIIGGGLAPYFNEAMANQMRLLSKKLNAHVITCNDIGWLPFKKMGQYLIVNSRFIFRKTPILSFINGAILYAIVKLYEKKFNTIIIPGGIESEFLRYLNPEKCIPIVTSIPFINESIQNKIKELAPKLKKIIVQSKKTRNQLMDMSIEPDKIILMYPLIDLSKFRYSEPPPLDEFRILFASSPNLEVPGEDNFRDKGLPLLLEAFKEFARDNSTKLYIVWRGKYNEKLFQKINKLDVKKRVNVINNVINMPEMYAKVHIIVIPFINLRRSPEIPMSALESLACGRPVVATDVGEIAEIVKSCECGSVSHPTKGDFLNALKDCRENYSKYQRNCRRVVKFLLDNLLERENTVMNVRNLSRESHLNHISEKKSLRLGIATLPISSAGIIPLSNIIFVLSAISKNIWVITGGEFYTKDSCRIADIYKVRYKKRGNFFSKVINYIYIQSKISLELLKLSKKVDLWIFFGGGGLILPILTSKILRKDSMLVLTASQPKCAKFQNLFPRLLNYATRLNYRLSNRIILYSKNLIKEWNLEKYKDKILIAHEHLIDFSKFEIKKKLSERNNLVDYIGRLSKEKGVLNFVRAIPEILKERNDMEFLIGGDGQLRDEIEKYVSENNLNNKVKLVGWIPHGNLPDYLNKSKLVVLPSYTEGLPNVMLEAMACGTPVLATPVGAIPDVITDGEMGFIMENNSPECIAENVIRVLEHPDLERVVESARALVEQEFTYEKVVKRWREILESI